MLDPRNGIILVVDDDAHQRRYLQSVLLASNFQCMSDGSAAEALKRLLQPGSDGISLVIADLHMPGMDGLEMLRRLRKAGSTIPVLVLTSDDSADRAVEAIKLGAHDFLIKPATPERLETTIHNALEMQALSSEVRRLAMRDENRLSFDELVSVSPSTSAAIKLAQRAAASDIPVLIEGESGTGKEVFARAVHGESARAGGPFVAVNCGALPANLVESILFGHLKGAFTGATTDRRGRFQEATGGTLFLDEVGELPPEAQVKLLRAIQTGEVDRIGATESESVDIRIVSATNRDLAAMVSEGTFREDLYYRLSVFPLLLPPLRDRIEDLPDLLQIFLRRLSMAEGKAIGGFSEEAMRQLMSYKWPGNVRQLQNTIHRAVVLSEGPIITQQDLVGLAQRQAGASGFGQRLGAVSRLDQDPFLNDEGEIKCLGMIEAEAIRRALRLYRGRMSETARRLGIGRSTLYRKIEELGIEKDMSHEL